MGERLEGADEAEDRQVEGHRREERHGDVPELLHARGPVHGRGLVELLGDVAKAGQEDHGVVAGVGPDAEDDHGHQRERGPGPEAGQVDAQAVEEAAEQEVRDRSRLEEPLLRRDAEPVEHDVSRPLRPRAEDLAEDRGGGDGRGDVGQEVEHAEELLAPEVLVQETGYDERQDDLDGHRAEAVVHGPRQASQEAPVTLLGHQAPTQ